MVRPSEGAVWCCSGVLLVSAAAFQAKAFGLLVADHLMPPQAADFIAERPAERESRTVIELPESRAAGEHNGLAPSHQPETRGVTSPVAPERTDVDPMRAPGCGEIRASVVSEFPDPLESVAQLYGSNDDTGRWRSVGDHFGTFVVVHIGFNERASSPAVWLRKDRQLCQVVLFGEAVATDESLVSGTWRPKSTTGTDTASDVERLGETRLRVQRSLLDDVLEQRQKLLGGVRVLPVFRDGQAAGMQVEGVQRGSLLERLGLQTGDRLEYINDVQLTDAGSVLRAYAQLRTAKQLLVRLTRNGKRTVIDVEVL